jgi:tRNA dimethylallyltransferase
VEQIKIGTRQLARRQMKWFKRFPQVHWLVGEMPLGEKVEKALGWCQGGK